jgi:POT family proton-dependent oligopeptide transporter
MKRSADHILLRGRFKTIMYSVIIAEVGHVIITVSAVPSMLDKPKSAFGLFVFRLIIMTLGTGTFKPNISPLVMEQIPQNTLKVKVNKKGVRVLEDPGVTATRIYNWFYLFINIGALIGQLAMVSVCYYH